MQQRHYGYLLGESRDDHELTKIVKFTLDPLEEETVFVDPILKYCRIVRMESKLSSPPNPPSFRPHLRPRWCC